MTTDLLAHILAVGPPGPEQGKGSPWGVVITLLLVAAVFVLGWSMQKHLKKIPASFDEPREAERREAEDQTEGQTEGQEAEGQEGSPRARQKPQGPDQ